jgi:hypothetical protein
MQWLVRTPWLALALGCHARPPSVPVPPPPPSAPVARSLPIQIKQAHDLPVRGEPVAFMLAPSALEPTSLVIDGREIPVTAYAGAPVDDVARSFARVPAPLRAVVTSIVIDNVPSANDAPLSKKYGLPVLAGMSTAPSGEITIYPHGIAELHDPDPDVLTRNWMHELGHCWTLHDWGATPAAQAAWVAAIESDRGVPSQYARIAYRNSGWPYEDAAEATALYFLVLGTPAFDSYRETMPARFALLHARFQRSDASTSTGASK